MNFNTRTKARRKRDGVAVMEVVVATLLTLASLTLCTPLIVSAAQMWKQTRHHQLVTDELSGRLDQLIALPPTEQREALENLTLSNELQGILVDAELTGEILESDDGRQIALSLDWKRVGDPPPVMLLGWVSATPSDSSNGRPATESSDPATEETR